MANGSGSEGPAYADRIREKYAKRLRAIDKAIEDSGAHRDLPAYREEMDSVSEATIGGERGVKVKAPPWVLLGLAALALAAFLAWLRFR